MVLYSLSARAISRPLEGRRVRSIRIASGGSRRRGRRAAINLGALHETLNPSFRSAATLPFASVWFQWMRWIRMFAKG